MIPQVESLPGQGWSGCKGASGMSFAETISPFFGRCAFVWFYMNTAMDITRNWHSIVGDMAAKHVPLPPLVLLVVLLLIVMGSISLLFGYHTRHTAILLFGMTMAATVTMHDFWHFPEAAGRAEQFAIFVRDFAICGGLLLLVGLGPGPLAVDNPGKSSGGKKR
jgi:putative oxidoreductase